jgi:hypothetical protein
MWEAMDGLHDSYQVQVAENVSTLIHLQTKEWNCYDNKF